MQQKVPFSLIRCSSSKVAFCSCVEWGWHIYNIVESESDPLTRRAVDLFEKEPLKGNSEVHLHTPTKFGEDRSKDLGGDREQTDRQTDRQTNRQTNAAWFIVWCLKPCSEYSPIADWLFQNIFHLYVKYINIIRTSILQSTQLMLSHYYTIRTKSANMADIQSYQDINLSSTRKHLWNLYLYTVYKYISSSRIWDLSVDRAKNSSKYRKLSIKLTQMLRKWERQSYCQGNEIKGSRWEIGPIWGK